MAPRPSLVQNRSANDAIVGRVYLASNKVAQIRKLGLLVVMHGHDLNDMNRRMRGLACSIQLHDECNFGLHFENQVIVLPECVSLWHI